MRFETFDSQKHSIDKVANLLYDVDFRTYDKIYKSKNQAIKDICTWIDSGDDTINVVLEDDKIIGVVVLYINKKPSFIDMFKEFHSFKLLIVSILDYFVICDVNLGDVYIADIAISSECRGKGIGTKVIEHIIDNARENNFKRVTLDADFRNTRVKKLYERIGFKVFNKKEFLKRRMFNMEYVLDEEK
ncbi:MAG: GNAT family N-acetyltransferase [Methanobrevibacter sp.]|nr:GNAT family N-acetyltransferase [Methanobrevibacter sp.]